MLLNQNPNENQTQSKSESENQIVLCTCPNQEVATKLGTTLVEAKLAACVNLIPGLTSIYTWQDKVETSTEILLLIKTQARVFHLLEKAIIQDHPYDCPEIISIPITHGFSGYLQWIEKSIA